MSKLAGKTCNEIRDLLKAGEVSKADVIAELEAREARRASKGKKLLFAARTLLAELKGEKPKASKAAKVAANPAEPAEQVEIPSKYQGKSVGQLRNALRFAKNPQVIAQIEAAMALLAKPEATEAEKQAQALLDSGIDIRALAEALIRLA